MDKQSKRLYLVVLVSVLFVVLIIAYQSGEKNTDKTITLSTVFEGAPELLGKNINDVLLVPDRVAEPNVSENDLDQERVVEKKQLDKSEIAEDKRLIESSSKEKLSVARLTKPEVRASVRTGGPKVSIKKVKPGDPLYPKDDQ